MVSLDRKSPESATSTCSTYDFFRDEKTTGALAPTSLLIDEEIYYSSSIPISWTFMFPFIGANSSLSEWRAPFSSRLSFLSIVHLNISLKKSNMNQRFHKYLSKPIHRFQPNFHCIGMWLSCKVACFVPEQTFISINKKLKNSGINFLETFGENLVQTSLNKQPCRTNWVSRPKRQFNNYLFQSLSPNIRTSNNSFFHPPAPNAVIVWFDPAAFQKLWFLVQLSTYQVK